MKTAYGFLSGCYLIHDSWSETLAGTYFLLGLLASPENKPGKIEREHLARLVIVSSHHLIEIMFFNTVKTYIHDEKSCVSEDVINGIEAKLNDRIGIKSAMDEWPALLLGPEKQISFGDDIVFQSQEVLRLKRNEVIHYKTESSTSALASSAYYTAIEVSKAINSLFFPNKDFPYDDFVKKRPPVFKEYFLKTSNKEIQNKQNR